MESPKKPDIGFQEALKRIAKAPKSAVEKVVNTRRDTYNEKEATEKSPPKRKPSS